MEGYRDSCSRLKNSVQSSAERVSSDTKIQLYKVQINSDAGKLISAVAQCKTNEVWGTVNSTAHAPSEEAALFSLIWLLLCGQIS